MWVTAFLDLPAEAFDEAVAFWLAVTGTTLSARRGEHAQFASLLPIDGDPWLRVQRLGHGPARIHLDLHADDPAGMRAQAVRLGATPVGDGPVVTFASPGGQVFCVVRDRLSRPAPTPAWPHLSRVDHVRLDISEPVFDAEAAFWAALLGAADTPPLTVLRQRSSHDGPVRAQLELATTDRPAEVARLVAVGAAEVRDTPEWTVLRDPAGLDLRVTDRRPSAWAERPGP